MATIKDVASKAGVSIATVSRILNNDSTLSTTTATKKRVFQAAEELGYKKVSRASKATFKLGVVQWNMDNSDSRASYYVSVIKGIEDYCIQNSIQIVRSFKSDRKYLDDLNGLDGIVCVGQFRQEEVEQLINKNNNIVFLDSKVEGYSTNTFTLDYKDAVNQVMNHIAGLGHRDIAFLAGNESLKDTMNIKDERVEAYRKYCKGSGIDSDKYLKIGQYTIESGYEMMKDLIDEGNCPTAVFAADDYIAFGAMKAIREYGMKIPEDISIVGFDDDKICDFTTPSLTTVHTPTYDLGQYGANFLFGATKLIRNSAIKVKIPCKLVERESCGRAVHV